MPAPIGRHMLVEDLIRQFPRAVHVLVEAGLPCVVCGEPFWGMLAELAAEKGWPEPRVAKLVQKLNHEFLKDR